MSVVRSKRSLSSSQFLDSLKKLMEETLTWCKAQGRKNDDYGLADLFKTAQKAYTNAYYANKTFLAGDISLKERRAYFDKALKMLHDYNAQLVSVSVCFKLSNTKKKRWSGYAWQAINQITAIKKSDTNRINAMKKAKGLKVIEK